jgi:arylsulfatase A-like enzyme
LERGRRFSRTAFPSTRGSIVPCYTSYPRGPKKEKLNQIRLVNRLIRYPAAVVAIGFGYGLAESLLALGFRPGGVSPISNFPLSLAHRCLFYTIFAALVGALTMAVVAGIAAVRRRKGPSPPRAAAAAMVGCALGANLFWTAVAISKIKRFEFWGREFNAWEPSGFLIFLFGPMLILVVAAALLSYKLLGKIKRPGAVVKIAAAAALAGWGVVIVWNVARAAARPEPAANYPDVLFITLDAWRADAFGPGDEGPSLTPNLDRFAEDAYVFTYARSQASWTLPSFATIFTSQYPAVHGAAAHRPLGTSQPTLAEILASRGYDTRAVVANELCLPFTGVPRGFREYHYWNMAGWLKAFGYYDTNFYFPAFRKGREEKRDSHITTVLTDATLERLGHPRGRPLFLWLHYLDPHAPYWPPPAYVDAAKIREMNERARETRKPSGARRENYNGEVRYVDHELARILRALECRPNTVVIISSDHGEEFFEHGGVDHGHTVYEELLRVPLIIKIPGGGSGRINMPVDTIDVAPTVLDYLGIEIPSSMQGRSLLPTMAGLGCERPSFAGPTQLKGSSKEAVYYRGKKFIYDYKYRKAGAWYDLADDPGEHFPRSPTEVDGVELWALLTAWRDTNREFRRNYRAAAEDGAIRDAMKAMGYVK